MKATSAMTIQQTLDLAVQLHQARRFAEAEQLYRRILAAQPNHAPALHLLGVIAQETGHNDAAVELIGKALAQHPDWPDAHYNMGNALTAMGRPADAINAYRAAVRLNPVWAPAWNNLANALRATRQLAEAVTAYRQAIAIRFDYPQAHCNLGGALKEAGQLDQAAAAYRQAIAIQPNYPEAYLNLASVLKDAGRLDEAIVEIRHAIAIRPADSDAYRNLSFILASIGQLDEAIAACRSALAVQPGHTTAHSNLLYYLQFHPGSDRQTVAEEHRRWDAIHARPLLSQVRPHTNDRDPNRRIRIGYVSPDFRRHPVGRFLMPLLENHDRDQVQVHCYASQSARDDVTERLAKHADAWRTVLTATDAELAELVRRDRIDILIDLSLHMRGNRLLCFARKPAPVQVTWLGYPGTTGLCAIDYRITDRYMDPLEESGGDSFYSEKLIHIPEASCYRPGDPTPEVNDLPALRNGHVTFGCLNNFCKVTDDTLGTWARVLAAVPDSRLLLYAPQGVHRQRARDRLVDAALNQERVRFVGHGGGGEAYFRNFHGIDICLDPFPYGGGTTTCESLWMGVPVVTLAGKTAFSRMGLGTLTCIGMPELVTHCAEDYIQTAIVLAGNLPRLAEIRAGLRRQMLASPLMDAQRFARNFEAALRKMWREWCQTPVEVQ